MPTLQSLDPGTRRLLNRTALSNPSTYQRFVRAFYPALAARPPVRSGKPQSAERGPKLPDLTDPDVQAKIEAEHGHLYRLFPALDVAYNLWVLTQAMFNSAEFEELRGSTVGAVGYVGNFDKWDAFAEPASHYFKMIGDQVEVGINVPSTSISLGLNYVTEWQGRDPKDEEGMQAKALEILRKFWPTLKMPTTWKGTRDGMTLTPEWTESKLISRRFAPQEFGQSSNFKVPWTPTRDWTMQVDGEDQLPEGFPFNEEYLQLYGGVLEMELELNLEKSRFRPNRSRNARDQEGSFEGIVGQFSLVVQPHFYIKLPLAYALWATHATNLQEFVPANFVHLVNMHTSLARNNGYDHNKYVEPPARLGNFIRTQTDTAAHVAALGMQIKPRVNADGLVILGNGRIAWVPQIDGVNRYYQLLRDSYDPGTAAVTPPEKIEGLANSAIWTDWINNKLVYANAEGNINTLDLLGCIPLDDVTIARKLNANIADQEVINFVSDLSGEAERFTLYNTKLAEEMQDPALLNMTDMLGFLVGRGDQWTFRNVGGVGLTVYKEETEVFKRAALKRERGESTTPDEDLAADWSKDLLYLGEINRILGELWKRFDTLKPAFINKVLVHRPYLVLLAKYAKDYSKYAEVYTRKLDELREKPVDLNNTTITAPNLPLTSDFGYLPHQASAISNLYRVEPECAMFDIQPGGGKSLTIMTEICQLLGKGKIRRPTVVVPGQLVKEFVKEINTFSKGQLNPFPINAKTMPRLLRTFSGDIKKLISYLRGMPKNTIFIVNYDFLWSQTDYALGRQNTWLEYGESWVRRWPALDVILQLEPDYIACDESHRVKNPDTSRAQATLRLICTAKYKRLSSGTIISNRPPDLVGQMMMLNPTIFGSVDSFNERFTGGTGIIPPAQESRVMAGMQPYTMHIVRKRRQWAHLLPMISEQFYETKMTERQSAFYDHLIAEARIRMRNDPKIKDLLDDETGAPLSEADEEKLEGKLKTYLARVEQFVVAPDTDTGKRDEEEEGSIDGKIPRFSEWDGDGMGAPTAADMISPKVGVVIEILRCHFGIGRDMVDPQVQKQVALDPSNKIIVFGYHKRASPHIMKNLPREFKAMAVHYTAGDEQAVIDFRDRPEIKILVADENSLKEGFNLQMASRIIRLQTLWSPGDVEQAVARIMRPDVRDQYSRTEVSHDWILANKNSGRPTIDVAKTGRLISKIVEKARLDNFQDPRWKSGFVDKNKDMMALPLIKMNFKVIDRFSWDSKDLRMQDANGRWRDVSFMDYFDMYSTYKTWELGEFTQVRYEVKLRVAEKLGKIKPGERPSSAVLDTLVTDREAKRLSMISSEVTKLAGSRPAYVPWVPGGNIHDEFGLSVKNQDGTSSGLTPLAGLSAAAEAGLDEDDTKGDDASDTGEDLLTISEGMPVLTEFGPGRIVRTYDSSSKLSKNVRVEVPGYGTMMLAKSLVWTAEAEAGRKKLDTILRRAGAAGLPKLKMDGTSTVYDPDKLAPETKVKKTKPIATVYTAVVNNMAVLQMVAKSEGNPDGVPSDSVIGQLDGWRKVPAHLSIKVTHQKGVEALIAFIKTIGYVDPAHEEALHLLAGRLRNRTGVLRQAGPVDYAQVRNFYTIDHGSPKQVEGRPVLFPYILVWDGDVWICFANKAHSASVINVLSRAKARVARDSQQFLSQAEQVEPILINFFRTKEEAKKDLENLTKLFTIENYQDVLSGIGDMVLHAAPKATPPKAPTAAPPAVNPPKTPTLPQPRRR